MGRKLFKKGDFVLVIGKVEEILLKAAIGDLPLELTFRKKLPANVKKFNKIVIGKIMDTIDEDFLSGLFEGRLFSEKGSNKIKNIENKGKSKGKKLFNILEPLTLEEIRSYSKLKKIKFNQKERKNQGKEFLDRLKNYSELKYNIYKNIKELRTIHSKD